MIFFTLKVESIPTMTAELRDYGAIRDQLIADEGERNRDLYEYSGDLLRNTGIVPLSIWPEPNSVVRGIISGEVDYNKLFDGSDEMYSNEFHKGGVSGDQEAFVKWREGQEMLCEALDLTPCLKGRCPLYVATDTKPPICREFKIVFRNS